MKKNIATFLRRVAQKLDPQKPEVTGYARKAIDFIPYNGIDIYRRLMIHGSENEAKDVKASMRCLAEIMASRRLENNLMTAGNIRLEHNFGTQDRIIDGISCNAGGMTVIVELNGSWS